MAKEVFFTINGNTGNAVKSIKELEDEIKRLQKEWKTAEDPFLRNKIGDSLKSAKSELQGFNSSLRDGQSFSEKITSSIKNGFLQIGGAIAGAFVLDKVISFGQESVKAFGEAEQNAVLLSQATGNISADFDRLIEQSAQLQEITIYSDDDIQKAQTAALQFGLTADQVEQLIPLVTDFASATGQDLNSALDAVTKGINGQGKGLKQYNIEVEKGLDKNGQFANIVEQLGNKFKGQAEIVGNTAAGAIAKYNNQVGDAQENIGQNLVEAFNTVKPLVLAVTSGFLGFLKVITALPKFLADNKGVLLALTGALVGLNAQQIIAAGLALRTAAAQKIQQASTIATTIATKGLNAAFKANPIGLIITLVTTLVGAFITLYQKSQTVRAGISGLFEAAKTAFTGIRDLAIAYIGGLGDLLVGVFTFDITKIKGGANKLLNGFKDYGANVAKSFSKGYNDKIAEENLANKAPKTAPATAQKAGAAAATEGDGGTETATKNEQEKQDLLTDIAEQGFKNRSDAAILASEKTKVELEKLEFERAQIQQQIKDEEAKKDGERNDNLITLLKAKAEGANIQIGIKKGELEKQLKEEAQKAINAVNDEISNNVSTTQSIAKSEADAKISQLQRQLLAVKGNAAEERRIKLEITKTKIQADIDETQAAIDGYIAKINRIGPLNKEEEAKYKALMEKLKLLNDEKNDAQTQSDKDANAEQDALQNEKIQKIIEGARAAADVVNQIIAESNRRAQEDIQNRLNLNEQAKTDRLAQLDAEYQREKEVRGASAALDKKYFDKKKQVEADYEKKKAALQLEAWKKEKDAKLKTSIINTALAIGSALASVQPTVPNGVAAAALAGAAGLAQTIIIAAQQPPKFSRGGILRGPSHSNGGIPLFGSGGQIYGEAEGGEVILTKNVSKSPELLNLASAINYAAGGRRFDRGGIITPITRFANGGIIEQAIGNNFNDLNATLASINQRLAEPPRAFVVEQEITAVQNKNALIERRSKIA